MPPVIASVSATLVAIGVPTATATWVAGTVVSLGVSAFAKLASMAISSLLAPDQTALEIGSNGQRVTIRQPVPRQTVLYGNVFTAGTMFFIEKNPPYLVIGYLLANHECQRLVSIYMNGTEVFFDSDGYATSVPFSDGSTKFFRISTRLGTADQAIDPIIASNFSNVDSEFRQRGHMTVVIEYNYGADDDEHREIWGETGRLQPIFRVRGKKIYDPMDGAQDVDDSSTWTWNNSPALCIADFLRYEYGGRLTSSDIDWDSFKEASRIDRQKVPLNDGGTENRYTCSGAVKLDATPFDVIQQMSTANFGLLTWANGTYGYISGSYRDPVGTIYESMLAGPLEMQRERGRKELVNKIRTEFVAPERAYQLANGPILENAAYITADGQTLEETIKLPFTEGSIRVQRMSKIYMEQTRLGKSLRVPVNIEGIQYTAGDIVTVSLENLSYVNGVYEIDTIEVDFSTMTFMLSMSEHSAAPFAWDETTEEQAFTLADIDVST